MQTSYYFDTAKVTAKLGLDKNGRIQTILDSQIVKYLRETMPVNSGAMMAQTRTIKPGETKVNTPYAHYMNEGIKYVMPENGKSAFYSPTYGYWSKKDEKKIPSNEPLQYHGGADRGAHFVERTCRGHYQDILNACKKGVKQ